MPTHVLIIPKDHYRDITDDVPPETLGHCFSVVKKIAEMEGLVNGFRILVKPAELPSRSVGMR